MHQKVYTKRIIIKLIALILAIIMVAAVAITLVFYLKYYNM